MDSQQLKTTDICLRVLSQFGPKNFKASLKGEPLDMTDVSWKMFKVLRITGIHCKRDHSISK